MRCLHCAKPVSLLKKLSHAEFCSEDHKRQYQAAVQKQMIERLRESGLALKRALRGDSAEPLEMQVIEESTVFIPRDTRVSTPVHYSAASLSGGAAIS